MQSTLVLNASYEPLSIVPATRAVVLILKDKASALDLSDATMHSANETFNLPYVILLTDYHKVGRHRPAPWTKRGVLVRDGWRCAYCGGHATTVDHVMPRSKGGADSFENCVAACLACNNKKDDKTLKQIGWHLPFVPSTPSSFSLTLNRANGRGRGDKQLEAWAPYFPEAERRALLPVA